MSFNNITRIVFISDDLNSLIKFYNYFIEIERNGSFLQYYHPEDYFNNETLIDTLRPDIEHSEDNADYCTLAFVNDEPEWGVSDTGYCFGIQLLSRIDPPVVYIKELCDLCFKDSEEGVEMIYRSYNSTASTYFTNDNRLKNSYVVECTKFQEELTLELKRIMNVAFKFTGKFVTKDELIEKLSPFYSEIKTDFNGVLKKLEQKYKNNDLRFIEVDYCPYGEF